MCAYAIECVYAIERAYICACTCICVSLCMFTRINANTVSYMRLHACLRAGLIKTHLRTKYFNTQTHFGFGNFQDVLYIHVHVCVCV